MVKRLDRCEPRSGARRLWGWFLRTCGACALVATVVPVEAQAAGDTATVVYRYDQPGRLVEVTYGPRLRIT